MFCRTYLTAQKLKSPSPTAGSASAMIKSLCVELCCAGGASGRRVRGKKGFGGEIIDRVHGRHQQRTQGDSKGGENLFSGARRERRVARDVLSAPVLPASGALMRHASSRGPERHPSRPAELPEVSASRALVEAKRRLEDINTTVAALPALLSILTVIAVDFEPVFSQSLPDITDLLLGWTLGEQLPESILSSVIVLFASFRWDRHLEFSFGAAQRAPLKTVRLYPRVSSHAQRQGNRPIYPQDSSRRCHATSASRWRKPLA